MDTSEAKIMLAGISALMIERPVETARTWLRPFRESDFQDYFEYAIQPEQQRLSGNAVVTDERGAREVFARFVDPAHPPLTFAIVWKETGKVIGNFSLGYYPFLAMDEALSSKRGVSLSYILNEDWWRRGIMTEVVAAASAWLLDVAGLDFVNAGYFSYNEGSRRVLEKAGFHHFMDHVFEWNGAKIDTREMILWRQD